jgi:hypothetical protein
MRMEYGRKREERRSTNKVNKRKREQRKNIEKYYIGLRYQVFDFFIHLYSSASIPALASVYIF